MILRPKPARIPLGLAFTAILLLLHAFGAPSPGTSPATAASPSPSIAAGEIGARGTVRSVDAGGHQLLVDVTTLLLPGGKTVELASSRSKTITVSSRTVLHDSANPDQSPSADILRPGVQILAIGKDLGVGQPLPAHDITVEAPAAAGSAGPSPSDDPPRKGYKIHVDSLPDWWGKGKVFVVANGGETVTGHGVTRDGIRAWEWSPVGGFRITAALPSGPGWDDDPQAPQQKLDAWNHQHGWNARENPPGKRLGAYTALYVFASSLSRDGALVVGEYGCTDTPESLRSFEAIGDAVPVNERTFIWKRGEGFCDLWDLQGYLTESDPGMSILPRKDTESISCAISPDGKTIALISDRLCILQAPPSGIKLPASLRLPG